MSLRFVEVSTLKTAVMNKNLCEGAGDRAEHCDNAPMLGYKQTASIEEWL